MSEIPPPTIALVRRLIELLAAPCRGDLMQQLEGAEIALGEVPFIAKIVTATGAVRCNIQDGPVPGRVGVVGKRGEIEGEMVLWIRAGRIDAVEFAWFLDPPTAWPSEASLAAIDR
jgi:hypothetical protein